MAQLTKLATGMSCFGQRNTGRVYLADGRTLFDDIDFKPGVLVKDVVNEVCQSINPPIVPVVRPFFALCELGTDHALCQSMTLTESQSLKSYQLRIFVNAGQNSICLKKYSRAAKNYYYIQLKTDFISGRLQSRMGSTNVALQMAAIDMVLSATTHKPGPLTTFEEVQEHYKLSRFLPPYIKSTPAWKRTLHHLYEEFYDALEGRDVDVIKVQYIFAYEKDSACGQHPFYARLDTSTDQKLFDIRIQVSWKGGIVMVTTTTRKEAINLFDIEVLDVRLSTRSVNIKFIRGGDTESSDKVLLFKTPEELISFCAVVDAYYRLKIDINSSILGGDATPVDDDATKRILGSVNPKDLCHGPICQESANEVFMKHQNTEGLYLVRESRTKDCTFILSVCQKDGICNYRICRDDDHIFALVDTSGVSPIPRGVNKCSTLNDLIIHHHHFKDGLPILLRDNLPPSKTGPMPLFPEPADDEDESPIIKYLRRAGVKRIHYRKELTVLKELGSGHFSSVHLAEWSEPGKEVQKVAIKIPIIPQQASKAQEVLDEMKREILTMYQLDHRYITKLLGVSDERHILDTIGRFPIVVMEFIDGGSLRGVLNDFRSPRGSNKHIPPDWLKRSLLYSQQIAEGMSYLGTKNVVHRDLATRNVLVVSESHIKIADFGLARQFKDNRDYYRATKRTDLPVYWYAPECFAQHFTSASDVWSYGVTLWEIFTLGRRPQEFLERIVTKAQGEARDPLSALANHFRTNNRLPRIPDTKFPDTFPHTVYQIIKQTWNIEPHKRPTFATLQELLAHELSTVQTS